MATGIVKRHARSCRSKEGGSCHCAPSYEAWVWSKRDGKKIAKRFPSEAAAKGWRTDSAKQVRDGTRRAPAATRVREAWDAWIEGAEAGTIRAKDGGRYKPSALRSYRRAMELRILDDLGARKLAEITRPDLQDLADRLLADGLDASTIRNAFMPLRAIYRRAISRGELAVNPTTALELPAVTGRRDRIASPDEAVQLLAAVPEGDRALWATAFYSGLRRGELRALRWEHVDLKAGTIHVAEAWDDVDGLIAPKSRAGIRDVPIVGALRGYLLEHRLRSGRAHGLVFGRAVSDPFSPALVRRRAHRGWSAAKLTPIGLHEARHTFASLMIAAGVNIKAISDYMGHASITITLDRYGHLLPGHAAEAVARMDAFLGTGAQLGAHPAEGAQ